MGMLEKAGSKERQITLRHTPGGVEVENQVDRESIIQSVKETAAPKKKPSENDLHSHLGNDSQRPEFAGDTR